MPTGIGGGSSTGGNDIRAGGAYVEIYGKDKLTKQLDGIKDSAKSQVMGLKGLLGGISLAGVVKTFADALINVQGLNIALEEGARLTKRMADIRTEANNRIFDKVGGKLATSISIIPEGPERIKYLEQQLRGAEKDLGATAKAAIDAKEKLQDLFSFGRRAVVENLPFAAIAQDVDREHAKRESDELEGRKSELQTLVKSLREQLAAHKALPSPWAKFQDTALQTKNDLRNQLGMLGLTPGEALIFKMRIEAERAGIPFEKIKWDLQEIKQLTHDLEQQKLILGIQEGAKNFDKDLEFRLRTHGMAPEQQQLEKMKEQDRWNILKENDANRAGMLAMMGDLNKLEAAKGQGMPEVPTASRFAGNVAGGFGGPLTQQLGISASFNREMTKKADAVIGWLEEMNLKLDRMQPFGFK